MQFRCPLRLCYSARAIMGSLLFFAFSWWGILVRIVAIVHFIRRRPDTYWLWIILIHWMGAVVYIAVEVLPDAGLLRQSFKVFPRRKRIRELEAAILDNPSAGNYEELADAPLLKWQWEISLLPYPTSSAWSRKTGSTIFIVPKDCWHTHTPIQASRKERKRYSSRRRRFPRYQKPITTMPRFLLLRIETRRQKNGRSESWRKSQPCPDICGGVSGPGSEERTVS